VYGEFDDDPETSKMTPSNPVGAPEEDVTPTAITA
jgi:hypothetical protein